MILNNDSDIHSSPLSSLAKSCIRSWNIPSANAFVAVWKKQDWCIAVLRKSIQRSSETFSDPWLHFPICIVKSASSIDRRSMCSDTHIPRVNVITLTNDRDIRQSPSNRRWQFVARLTFHSWHLPVFNARRFFRSSPFFQWPRATKLYGLTLPVDRQDIYTTNRLVKQLGRRKSFRNFSNDDKNGVSLNWTKRREFWINLGVDFVFDFE